MDNETDYDQHDMDTAQQLTDLVIANEEKSAKPRDETSGRFVKSAPDAEEQSEPVADAADDDAAPEEASGEDEGVEPETAIDPPTSWAAEHKDAFTKLPPDLQALIAERESERERGLNAKLSEAAGTRKTADTELEAAKQERQRLAALMGQVSQYAQAIDPIIFEGDRMDWSGLAEKERIGEVEPGTFNMMRARYEDRKVQLQAFQSELQRMQQQNIEEGKKAYSKRLSETFPDFADAAKGPALKAQYAPTLSSVGFTADEIAAGWDLQHDPRYLLILDKASKWDKVESARKTLAAKKAQQPAPKVGKPKAKDDTPQKSTRLAALEKQAEKTGRISDLADYILAQVEERPT